MSLAGERALDDGDEALGQFLIALRARGHRSQRLLEAVERAPRSDFVRPEHVGFAYHDMSLPLPFGQETGRPLGIVAAVATLEIEPQHAVLEIGGGSGWQSALLAGLARAVASIERWQILAQAAERRLMRLGFTNAVVIHADGLQGLEGAEPFDRVVLNGTVRAIPDALARQVRQGGIILAPIQAEGGTILTRFRRLHDDLVPEAIGPVDATPLVAGAAKGA